MDVNDKLKKLYASKWNALCNELEPAIKNGAVKPANPLLIDLGWWSKKDGQEVQSDSWYVDADIRVMVFGQETNGKNWYIEDDGQKQTSFNLSYDSVLGIYENFYETHGLKSPNNAGICNTGSPSTFFSGLKTVITLLNQKYPDKKIGYIWNNIVKIGKENGKGCDNSLYSIEQKNFKVIPQEMEILKPHIIIFLTRSYDDKIKDNFGAISFSPLSPFSEKEVAKVKLPDFDIPAYRTRHPSARISNEEREKYYKAIINDINI